MKIDQINRKIIALLSQDSRMPISEIADKVGRSRTVVAARIEQLEQQGEIVKFTVQLRKKQVTSIFEIKLSRGFTCHDVVSHFKQKFLIQKAWSVAGETDLFIFADFDTSIDLANAQAFLAESELVDSLVSHIVLSEPA